MDSLKKFVPLSDCATTVTQISTFDGENIRIRGIRLEELCESASYLEVAYLVLNGRLPKQNELDLFSKEINTLQKLDETAVKIIADHSESHSLLDHLRSIFSDFGVRDADAEDRRPEIARAKGLKILAQLPQIIAGLFGGCSKAPTLSDQNFVLCFLQMLLNRNPDQIELSIFEKTLIVHIENELNISTLTARLAISTQSDFYSAITAAISVLKGPLHGGANQKVAEMIDQIDKKEKVSAFIDQKIKNRERVMGFGHLLYKNGDPRAVILRNLARELASAKNQTSRFEIYKAVEDEVKSQKNLLPNVDFYSACIFQSLGLDKKVFPAIFAFARFASWIAHIEEQLRDNKMFVARAEYQGIATANYRPIAER